MNEKIVMPTNQVVENERARFPPRFPTKDSLVQQRQRFIQNVVVQRRVCFVSTMVTANPITEWIKSGMEAASEAEASFEDRVAE
jgi:hypothetical protein